VLARESQVGGKFIELTVDKRLRFLQ